MSHFELVQTLKTLWKQCAIVGGVCALLVLVGAWGREDAAGRGPVFGYSVIALTGSAQNAAKEGWAPIRMHQPVMLQFQRTGETRDDEGLELRRHARSPVGGEMAPREAAQAQMLLMSQAESRRQGDAAVGRADMFSSLKNGDEKQAGRDRARATDETLSWGWLADGVMDREHKEKRLPDAGKPYSADGTAVNDDPLSIESFGRSGADDITPGGKGRSWWDMGTDLKP